MFSFRIGSSQRKLTERNKRTTVAKLLTGFIVCSRYLIIQRKGRGAREWLPCCHVTHVTNLPINYHLLPHRWPPGYQWLRRKRLTRANSESSGDGLVNCLVSHHRKREELKSSDVNQLHSFFLYFHSVPSFPSTFSFLFFSFLFSSEFLFYFFVSSITHFHFHQLIFINFVFIHRYNCILRPLSPLKKLYNKPKNIFSNTYIFLMLIYM